MKKYYLHNGSENIGPFDIDELKEKKISRDTPVWCEGMMDWKNASEVDELRGILSAIPPPLKKETAIPTQQKINKQTEESNGNNFWASLRKLVIIILVVVGIIAVIGSIASNNDSSSKSFYGQDLTPEELEAMNPTDYLKADGKYHTNLLGTKLVIEGFVDNSATITAYKDVTIDVIFYDNSKIELNRESFTINDFFPANSRKNFKHKVTNYSNVKSIGWEVSNAVPNR